MQFLMGMGYWIFQLFLAQFLINTDPTMPKIRLIVLLQYRCAKNHEGVTHLLTVQIMAEYSL